MLEGVDGIAPADVLAELLVSAIPDSGGVEWLATQIQTIIDEAYRRGRTRSPPMRRVRSGPRSLEPHKQPLLLGVSDTAYKAAVIAQNLRDLAFEVEQAYDRDALEWVAADARRTADSARIRGARADTRFYRSFADWVDATAGALE